MSAPAPSMYSPAAKSMAEKLGLTMGRANLEEFAETLVALAKEDRQILVVTSDSRGSGKLGPFAQALPRQLVEVGIAEQNLVGITAGLAAAGTKAFGVSPACFLTARALEQIKNDLCYSDMPAAIVGISAGVSYGALGSTHHSLHDLAALRAISNMTIIAPADNFETTEAVRAAVRAEHPVYLRFGKAVMYRLQALETRFEVGRAITVRDGNDVAFIATGETVVHALLAAGLLAEHGLSCRVLSMHTLKPLDVDAVLRAGREYGAVITVEEHSIHGGLGEACAAELVQAGVAVPMRIVGVPDEDTVTGSQADIFRHYGITMEGLAHTAMQVFGRASAEVRRSDLRSPVAQALIASLNAELTHRYPEEGANFFRLDPHEVENGRGGFYVAYIGGKAVGCGAVRRIDDTTAEIKRMYVAPTGRGCGIGRTVLVELEAEARRLGVRRLVLETGPRQPEALALYKRAGFVEIPLFGEYVGSQFSVCMEKNL
jgi:transketolase